ncbi:hypothetical protein DFH09DRAFT_1311872 [Mycena vulgaris]|nr:hypothetical protein DFH09DRAFT_1311872 [Mycena vulgaris]
MHRALAVMDDVNKADTLLLSARNPYIDDRAEVQRSLNEDDQYEDDEDSSEVQIRRADEADFNMSGILADHDARVLSSVPYRMPAHFLQPGAETPARGEDVDTNTDFPPSRETSVMPTWHPPPQTGSQAPTPAYKPAEPTSSEGSRGRTPLFFPDPESRGPTPFQPRDSRDFTPYISPCEALAAANPNICGPPLLRVWGMGTASPPPKEARARHLYKKLTTYLDTTATDSDEENDPQDGEEEEEELHDSDIEFIDDTPPQLQTDQLWTFDDNDDDDTNALEAIAARFENRACDYSASAACEKPGATAFVAPNDPALGVIARTLSPSANVRPAPHNETLRGMERRLRSALPNPGEVVRGLWIRFQGELAFVLGPKELLMKRVDAPPPPPQSQNPKAEETPDPCQPRQVGTKLSAQKYPQVDPAIDELAPFRGTHCQEVSDLLIGPTINNT